MMYDIKPDRRYLKLLFKALILAVAFAFLGTCEPSYEKRVAARQTEITTLEGQQLARCQEAIITGVTALQATEIALFPETKGPITAYKDTTFVVYYKVIAGFESRELTAAIRVGDKIFTDTIFVSGGNEDDIVEAFNIKVPAESITDSYIFAGILEASPGDMAFEAWQGMRLFALDTRGPLEIKIVPINYTFDGRFISPNFSPQRMRDFAAKLKAMLPVEDVSITMTEAIYYSKPLTKDTGLSDLLHTIKDKRKAAGEKRNVLYYGIVTPGYSYSEYCSDGCSLGLGYIPGHYQNTQYLAAVGVSFEFEQASNTFVHEVGHNLSLAHTGCKTEASNDSNYPIDNGTLDTWGYDKRTDEFLTTDNFDIMGYCEPKWISTYHYQQTMVRLSQVNSLRFEVENMNEKEKFDLQILFQ